MKYLCDPHIIPGILPVDFAEIESYASRCAAFTDWLQIDIADGRFAKSLTWPFRAAPGLSEISANRLPQIISCEMHLMTEEPGALGEMFARAGARRIIGHIEAFADESNVLAALRLWKQAGAQEVGLSVMLGTPLQKLEHVIAECGVVQLMSFKDEDLGYQGRPFDDRALDRIEELHAMYPELMVAVDGGVSEAVLENVVRAGANRIVMGGVLKNSSEPEKLYARLHERAMQGCAPQRAEVAV